MNAFEHIICLKSEYDKIVGTGTLISNNLVVTAYHVFEAATQNKGRPGEPTKIANYPSGKISKLVWRAEADRDLAVVQIAESFDAFYSNGFAYPVSVLHDFPVVSGGYPLARSDNGQWDFLPIKGTISKKAGNSAYLQTGTLMHDPNYWMGISGAPVITTDGVLLGVVKQAEAKVSGGLVIEHFKESDFETAGFHASVESVNSQRITEIGPSYSLNRNKPPYVSRLKFEHDEDLANLAKFFKMCVHFEDDGGAIDLNDFASTFSNQRTRWVKLRGSQGAGKTTFLSALYAFLSHNNMPVRYIDASSVVENKSSGSGAKIIDLIASLQQHETQTGRYVLMVDNLGGRDLESKKLVEQINENLNKSKIAMVVWAMTDDFEHLIDQIPPFELSYDDPSIQFEEIVMDDVSTTANHFEEFLNLFVETRRNNPFPSGVGFDDFRRTVDYVIDGRSSINQHILYMIVMLRDEPELKGIRSITDVMFSYCNWRIAKGMWGSTGGSLETQYEAATSLAYKTVACRLFREDPSEKFQFIIDEENQSIAKLVGEHPDIRDFLAANYIIGRILKLAKIDADEREKDETLKSNKELIGPQASQEIKQIIDDELLEFDFPQKVSNFTRDLAKAQLRERKMCLRAMRLIVDYLKQNPSLVGDCILSINFIAYLSGRMPKAERGEVSAATTLSRISLLVDTLKKDEKIKRGHRLVAERTIAISRAKLNLEHQDDLHLLAMLRRPELASIDRGYHLLYYGDASAYKELAPECYEDDPSKDWRRTERHLRRKIEARLNGLSDPDDAGDQSKLDSDIQHKIWTYLSFVQSRIPNTTAIGRQNAQFAESLIKVALTYRGWPDELIDYMKMLLVDLTHLNQRGAGRWRFIFDLYYLKMEPRRGWLKRELKPTFDPSRIESVADHTYLTILLAQFLLPSHDEDHLPIELMGEAKYDKNEVLAHLMFHDIAEAYTGDFIARDIEVDTHRRMIECEASAHSHLRWQNTYGLFGTDVVFELCDSVSKSPEKRAAKETINTILAKDLDKIENLIQAHVYLNLPDLKESIRDELNSFKSSLLNEIKTEYFQNLTKELNEWAETMSPNIFRERPYFDEELIAKGTVFRIN